MTNLIYMFVLNNFCEAEEMQWVKTLSMYKYFV